MAHVSHGLSSPSLRLSLTTQNKFPFRLSLKFALRHFPSSLSSHCRLLTDLQHPSSQIHTHLFVLKELFPNGINMLSLFSSIGRAEVALHRLGIKLKNIVSIEKSKANRDIVRSWWGQANQTMVLMDFDDVHMFDAQRIEEITSRIGPFDLVGGDNPCNNLASSNRVSRDGLKGSDSKLFYDYFRIIDYLVKAAASFYK